MAFPGTGKIWLNGTLVDWKDANIHIASHVIHYGSGVFEGARCYDTVNGPACFRLDPHMRRLIDSARIYRMESAFTQAQLTSAVLETIRANGFSHCYIRPLIYRGYDSLGVFAEACPIEVAILVWEWGTYFSQEALEEGLDVKISTWSRLAPNTLPAMAKCVAMSLMSLHTCTNASIPSTAAPLSRARTRLQYASVTHFRWPPSPPI